MDVEGLLRGLRRIVDGGWLAEAELRAARAGMKWGQGVVKDSGEEKGNGDGGQGQSGGTVEARTEMAQIEVEESEGV